MHTNSYEEAFDKFINSREYDRVEEAIFQFARDCFEAGYKAAGGVTPDGDKIIDILRHSLDDKKDK